MPAFADGLVILREIARQAPFRVCRALADGRPALVWCLRRPGLSPRAAEAPFLRLAGQEIPGVATFLGTSWARGEYRVAVGAPAAETWLGEWLSGRHERSERLLVAAGLARAVAGLFAAGSAHGALGEESFMVDTEGCAVLVDWSTTQAPIET